MSKEPTKREMDAQQALESLTPGGSEFSGDPEACAEFVQYTLDNKLAIIKRMKRQRDEAIEGLATLCTLLADAPALLERAAGLAEVATCKLCPEHNRCSAFSQSTESQPHPCDVTAAALRELAQALRAALREEEEEEE